MKQINHGTNKDVLMKNIVRNHIGEVLLSQTPYEVTFLESNEFRIKKNKARTKLQICLDCRPTIGNLRSFSYDKIIKYRWANLFIGSSSAAYDAKKYLRSPSEYERVSKIGNYMKVINKGSKYEFLLSGFEYHTVESELFGFINGIENMFIHNAHRKIGVVISNTALVPDIPLTKAGKFAQNLFDEHLSDKIENYSEFIFHITRMVSLLQNYIFKNDSRTIQVDVLNPARFTVGTKFNAFKECIEDRKLLGYVNLYNMAKQTCNDIDINLYISKLLVNIVLQYLL